VRVVVADNDRAVVDLLVLDLGLEGHDVVAAVLDGAGAVRACAELSPDVLVVDLRLGPGPDGIDVAGQVATPGLRIVLHTNYVTPETVRRATRVGALVVEKGNLRALRRAVSGDGGGGPGPAAPAG
jgi:CheY-like chemotaxis protein